MTVRKVARQEARKAVNRDIETKHWEGSVTYAIPYLGINVPLTYTYGSSFPVQTSVLSQGSAYNNYVGDVIRPTYIEIRYSFVYADAYNKVGLQVFQGKGSFIPIEADASSQWTGVSTGWAPISFIPPDYDSRLKLLARRTHVVDSANYKLVTGTIKISGKRLSRIKFLQSGAIESGELFMSVISDSSTASHPGFEAAYRVYYKDA